MADEITDKELEVIKNCKHEWIRTEYHPRVCKFCGTADGDKDFYYPEGE